MTTPYPKRLIEVDLPIKAISAHARREKSIRHGHISTLHIWWARRPLAACRAVLCASLWPDPVDENCPQAFRDTACNALSEFADKVRTDKELAELCRDHWTRWRSTDASRLRASDPLSWPDLRYALLDFIADFAAWEASSVEAFVVTARLLTRAAHRGLCEPGRDPVVVDPFSGGGSIPSEAGRIGAEAFAFDINPVAVLLEKVYLDYIPRFGKQLERAVHEWGGWVEERAKAELSRYYPTTAQGEGVVAYIWARTVRCQGPACGAEIPLVRSLWLAKKGHRSVAFKIVPDRARGEVRFDIVDGIAASDVQSGTVARGSATCPLCGFTTPVADVRRQLAARRGGTRDARLLCVIANAGPGGVSYRAPTQQDIDAASLAAEDVLGLPSIAADLPAVPDEPLPRDGTLGFRIQKYGMTTWGDVFAPRQQLVLATFARLVRDVRSAASDTLGHDLAAATSSVLAMALGKLVDYESSLCIWRTARSCAAHTFGRQALPITWDFAEMNPFAGSAGDWGEACRYLEKLISEVTRSDAPVAHVGLASATRSPLPDRTANMICTDPPYYDAVPYAALSDFFYVWHRRAIPHEQLLTGASLTPKDDECIVDTANGKTRAHFENSMRDALVEARRILSDDGIGVVVFAHKATAGWEAQLQAMLDAGWSITGSWPVDTERPGRLRANDSAALASSVHIVCRPRADLGRGAEVGSWRRVLSALPERIHDWMPRLADEGVVGADAIFACLGPALEIFSQYARVEKASGDPVELPEYLEQVWAAVSKEALSMMFDDADASGLEEDARLTAMWLWTLGTGSTAGSSEHTAQDDRGDSADDEEIESSNGKSASGYSLEYDAARKIAQGLGAHLEKLGSVVEINKGQARLLAVAERAHFLFGKDDRAETGATSTKRAKKSKKKGQLGLFAEIEAAENQGLVGPGGAPTPGATTLDRVHQAMLLFGTNRSEPLKRFVVEDGAGSDPRFWKLAQSLSYLYPVASAEKRWVDGVLARKKSLGF